MSHGSAIELVVFDCDGVLLESVEAKSLAFEQLVRAHGPEAVDRLLAFHHAHGGVSRYEKFAWFVREVLGREITPEESQNMGQQFAKLSRANVLDAPMVPGALDALDALRGTLPLYVASGAPHGELVEILTLRGLAGYFTDIYGSPPAKSALLRRCIDRSGVAPTATLMIGDSSTDLDAARENGTQFYGRGSQFAAHGVPWGHDLTELIAHIRARHRSATARD